MKKKKYWNLAKWCFLHMKLGIDKNGYSIYQKCWRNDLLIKLLNMSNVTPDDIPETAMKNLKCR